MPTRTPFLSLALALALAVLTTDGPAQTSGTAEQLIRQEEVRRAVEDAYALYGAPVPSGTVKNDLLVEAVERLAALGQEAVPFLAVELDQVRSENFFLTSYALGRIGTAEAEAALRAAVERAEGAPGDWAATRKGWACWALGLMGRPDAVDLAMSGRHVVGLMPIHAEFTVLDSLAVQTAPASAARLKSYLERLDDEADPRYSSRVGILGALGFVGTAEARDTLIGVLRSDGPGVMRRQAAFGLGSSDTDASIEALLAALQDEDVRVRRAAAIALFDALPVGRLDRVETRLAEETNPIARGALYRVLARAGGAARTDLLVAQWGREDATDRWQLVQVLPQLDAAKVVPVLLQALEDPDSRVRIAATIAVSEIEGPEARQLLMRAAFAPEWSQAATAIDRLERLGETEAADPLAARLIEIEALGVVTDPRRRAHIERLGEALVNLGGTKRIDEIKASAAIQEDGQLVEYLARLIPQLEILERNGKKTKRWIETLGSDNPDLRLLAYERLGRSGDKRAARPMAEMFGRVAPEEGVAILRALGGIDSPDSRELIARVLAAPEFDPIERASLRDMAAWGARRLGDAEMRAALRAAVERRDGRDTLPLVYLAVLERSEAIPLLERVRTVRLRYITSKRGAELEKLDWIRRELARGRDISSVDVAPRDFQL